MKALRKLAKRNIIPRAFSLTVFKVMASREKILPAILRSREDPGVEVGQKVDKQLGRVLLGSTVSTATSLA